MSETGDKIIERILSFNNELQKLCGEPLKEVWIGAKAYDSVAHCLMRVAIHSKDAEDPRGKYNHGLIYIGSTKVRRAE